MKGSKCSKPSKKQGAQEDFLGANSKSKVITGTDPGNPEITRFTLLQQQCSIVYFQYSSHDISECTKVHGIDY